jgi:hypothetical protein
MATSMFNEVDTMLSGSTGPGTALSAILTTDPDVTPPEPSELFSTYLLSPAYFAETSELLLVKLLTAKGEPFFLLDPTKNARSLVCGLTEIFLTPYDPETACVDECRGLPALHIVPDCIIRPLFAQALRGICNLGFIGLVFVSSVGMQFYYRLSSPTDGTIVNLVYRVAVDNKGQIEAREVRGAVSCDYPVPYFLIDYAVMAEGKNSVEMVESLAKANASLIDSLCRIEYAYLHAGEDYPDTLDSTLGNFMGRHSHVVKGLLEAQLHGLSCDDAFVRRQRKGEIDSLVRLMMREVELLAELKKILDELAYVQGVVEQCPQPGVEGTTDAVERDDGTQVMGDPDDELQDPLLRPLIKMSAQSRDARAKNVLGDVMTANDMISRPMTTCDDDSGSECSR